MPVPGRTTAGPDAAHELHASAHCLDVINVGLEFLAAYSAPTVAHAPSFWEDIGAAVDGKMPVAMVMPMTLGAGVQCISADGCCRIDDGGSWSVTIGFCGVVSVCCGGTCESDRG